MVRQIFLLVLLSCSALAQTPVLTLDLRPHGYIPHQRDKRPYVVDHSQPLFLSDGTLIVALNEREVRSGMPLYGNAEVSRLLRIDQAGRVTSAKDLPIRSSEYAVTATPDNKLVIESVGRLTLCSSDFRCDKEVQVPSGASDSSQDNRYITIRHPQGLAVVSTTTLETVRPSNPRVQQSLQGACAYQSAMPGKGIEWSSLVTASDGKRFALDQRGYSRLNRIVNLTDIKNARPPNVQIVTVHECATGRKIFELKRNPRPWSSEIALSPDGKHLALIHAGVLRLFAIP
jgi:hypothetical protein